MLAPSAKSHIYVRQKFNHVKSLNRYKAVYNTSSYLEENYY